MHHDSTSISNNFTKETSDHADHEPPGFVLDPEPKLRYQKQTKGGGIDDIARKGG